MTHSRRELLDLLDRHGVTLSRALGQNYVADPNTVRRIARLAGVGPGDRVVEIGAGAGSLTLALAETGATVTAIEVDRHVLPALREVVEPRGVRVVAADAMALDWATELEGDGWVLVANLPYNIATPLILDVLRHVPAVERMLVMVQREVAERLAASPGSKAYGIPTVKRAWWADAAIVGRVPATVFVPPPRVESALLRLDRRAPPAGDLSPDDVFPFVDEAFRQRRKMLRRSLVHRIGTDSVYATAGVRADARPEELRLADWVRLVRATQGANWPTH